MNRNAKYIAALVSAVSILAWTAPVSALDLQSLEEQGELYVVALYSGYESEADFLDRAGREEAAAFLRSKANSVEGGAELFPLHPMVFAVDEENKPALMAAYNETFALVGSEAADVAPERIVAIQVVYETWIFAESGAEKNAVAVRAQSEKDWQLAFMSFIDWSEGTESFSALDTGKEVQLSENIAR